MMTTKHPVIDISKRVAYTTTSEWTIGQNVREYRRVSVTPLVMLLLSRLALIAAFALWSYSLGAASAVLWP